MTQDLEGTPSETEETTTPPEEDKSTVRTYTQEELDKAVGKGLSSLSRQLSITKAEVDALRKSKVALEKDLQELESKTFEDPDVLEGFRKSKAIERKEREIALKETEINAKINAISLNNKADELQAKYQVPREVLEACNTEEQMERIAMAFPVAETAKEKPPPKFDSNQPSGGQVIYTAQRIAEMRDQIIRLPKNKAQELMDELDKAYREGRVKK